MKHITVLSGAGISAESGLKTFRDSDGLWMGHKIEDVATPQAFKKSPTGIGILQHAPERCGCCKAQQCTHRPGKA